MNLKKNLVFSILIILGLIWIIFPVLAEPSLSHEEWKNILAIGDEIDYLTVADLTLFISPDHYYQIPGQQIVLSGTLKGIFGPLSNASVLIERYNGTNLSSVLETVTNANGVYILTDYVNETGPVDYQAQYVPKDNSRESLKSDRYQVLVNWQGEQNILNEEISFVNLNSTNGSFQNYGENLSLSLNANSLEFVPGESISLFGYLVSYHKPIPYAPIKIYPDIYSNITDPINPLVPGQTKQDGRVNFSYHLSGPDSVHFFLSYQKNQNEPIYRSNTISFIPLESGINPPARIVHEKETIIAYLQNETVDPIQNITVYGWYNGNGGSGVPLSSLDLVWYNFGEKIWDRYQNSSQVLTNADGKFECTVKAPQTPGMYLLGMRRRPGSVTSNQLYSNVLALSVVIPELKEDYKEVQPTGNILLQAQQSPIRLSDKIGINISQKGFDELDTTELSLLLYYSDNGYEWKILPYEEIKRFSEEQKTVFIQPDKPGYWYFRASYNDISHEVVSSDVLVVPVLPFDK